LAKVDPNNEFCCRVALSNELTVPQKIKDNIEPLGVSISLIAYWPHHHFAPGEQFQSNTVGTACEKVGTFRVTKLKHIIDDIERSESDLVFGGEAVDGAAY
jgi:hypothetical protein